MNNYKCTKRLSGLILLIAMINQLFNYPILQVQALSFHDYEECKNIDIRLQDDFYNAINKEWIVNTKLDNGYVSYGTFEDLCGRVNGDIYKIIQDISKNKDCYVENSDELKLLNLYENFLDMKKRDKMGIKPIKSYMKKIDSIKNIEELKKIFYEEDFMYFQPLINIGVGADYKDSHMNVLYFGNSNLTLGNSLYYKNECYENIREEYINYIAELHKLYGENKNKAVENAEKFYYIEKNISNNIPTYQEVAKDNNRINSSYNVFTLHELESIAPNIGISNMLNHFNLKNPNKIIVENPENIKFINSQKGGYMRIFLSSISSR